MMGSSAPSAPATDWSIIASPAPMQAQIVSMLAELVARLSTPAIAEQLQELAVKARALDEGEAAVAARERDVERRAKAIRRFIEAVVPADPNHG
jgi:hypothetical protein